LVFRPLTVIFTSLDCFNLSRKSFREAEAFMMN
jgi:hypothetical protein